MFVHEAPIERRWWPRGIVTGTTPDPERGPMCHKVHTRWGTLRGWWPSEGVDAVLEPAWWAGRVDAMEVESVEHLAEDDLGRLVRLIGEDRVVARLLHLQPRSAPDLRLLVEEVVPLIQVIDHGGAPSILIHADHDPVSDSPLSTKSMGDLLGRVQARWSEHGLVTGPTPRWWNDRLKRLEDATRATTLWRAPLTRDAVGLPSIHLHPSCLVRIGGAPGLRLDPDPAVLELIDTTHRRPAMAQLAALERLIPETSQHRDLHDAWAVHVPERWSSRRAHDTTRGGYWIQRYEAALVQSALGLAFDDDRIATSRRWLNDVDRIQAALGANRVWAGARLASWLLGALLLVSPEPSGITSIALASLCVAVGVGFGRVYTHRAPNSFAGRPSHGNEPRD